jgi:hypothetical protein
VTTLAETGVLPLAPRGHIILDSIETWPASIRDILASKEVGLRSYVEEELRLDECAREDMMLRYRPRSNPHKRGWQETTRRVRELADAHPVVGFHCSRLIPEEIDDIRATGLRPLSHAFTCERIDRLVHQNLVSAALAPELKRRDDSPHAGLARREGLLSFFHCLSTLERDEEGLYRLLRYWGGEAVYGHHPESSLARDALRRIGTPCIVLATLRPSDVGIVGSFEERLIGVWLDRGRANAHSHDCDTQVANRSVPVFDVVEYADPRFERLTSCSKWEHWIDSSA